MGWFCEPLLYYVNFINNVWSTGVSESGTIRDTATAGGQNTILRLDDLWKSMDVLSSL